VTASVLMLELNELCPPLLERFMVEGDLPGFTRLHDEAKVFTTEAEEPQGQLNPWIQWVTAHTGVGYDQHRVFKLGEGAALTVPTVADVVGEAGGTVWLCGPMNVVPTSPVRGRWLPDPWNPDASTVSADLAPFAGFVRANVQEHTNVAHRLTPREYIRFVTFMVRHGLSARTVAATARQLIGERTGRVPRWQRAALLDRFQWDLFEYIYRRECPRFATYFSNTTAHYQHVYWRYMDPEPFDLKPTAEEIATYGDAIPSGYRETDHLVSRALDLADATGATLVFCSALSQQPYLLKEDQGGSRFYRPHDIRGFVDALGLTGITKVAPVMSAQFHVFFSDEDHAATAEQVLAEATASGQPAFDLRRVGLDLFVGFARTDELPADALIEVPGTGARIPVHEALYRAETAKSGYHHPSGALWIRTADRRGVVAPDPVPLRSVAPTILRLLDVEPPTTMTVSPLALGSVSPMEQD